MEIPSRQLKHRLFLATVVDGGQTAKIVLNNSALLDGHGFPGYILSKFEAGVPLDLNPRFPLDLEVDEDGFSANLAFEGAVSRCFVPWRAVAVFAIGLGGVQWEHEAPEPRDPDEPLPEGVIDFAARKKSR